MLLLLLFIVASGADDRCVLVAMVVLTALGLGSSDESSSAQAEVDPSTDSEASQLFGLLDNGSGVLTVSSLTAFLHSVASQTDPNTAPDATLINQQASQLSMKAVTVVFPSLQSARPCVFTYCCDT
jgi:hypothetical protein